MSVTLMLPNADVVRNFPAASIRPQQAAPPRAAINRYPQGQSYPSQSYPSPFPAAAPQQQAPAQDASGFAAQPYYQDPLLRSTRGPARPPAPARVQTQGQQPPVTADGRDVKMATPVAAPAAGSSFWPRRALESGGPASPSSPPNALTSYGRGPVPQVATIASVPQVSSVPQTPVPQVKSAPKPSPPAEPTPAAIPGPEVGWYTRQGIKPGNPAWVNQDSQLAMQLPGDRLLVGVFDGHGEFGHRASGTAKAVINQMAPTVLGSLNSGPQSLRQLFAQVQAEFQNQEIFQQSGTTATLALIDPVAGAAHVAHVGDSTLALFHGGTMSFQTNDHRIDEAAEQRIKARGGAIQTVGAQKAKRVYVPDNGRGYAIGLSLDRSLGDLDLSQAGVISEPEVKENLPFQPGTVLIIASDGVWDVVPKAHAAQAVMLQDIEDSAHALVDTARSRWAAGQGQIDDITAVVVKW